MSYGSDYPREDPRQGYPSSGQGPSIGRAIGMRFIPVLVMAAMAGLFLLQSCQRGPFGRNQVIAIGPEEEKALGLQAFQQVLSESNVISRGPTVEAVTRVARRLAEASNSEPFRQAIGLPPQQFEWDFRVVDSDQINAFCLPGGKVVVFTGILPVAQTEEGLATVVGHEIGHAIARHSAERMAQTKVVQMVQQGVAVSMSDMAPQQVQQVMGMLGVGSQVGILLPFSRNHESEADHIGILLMSAAGYDPHEASRFWIRMQEATSDQKRPPEFLSTHPNSERRAEDLEAWLPEAIPLYQASQKQPTGKPLPMAGGLGGAREEPLFPIRRPSRERSPFPK
ncbi:M48 family metallopeptidase [bacterium]|nr:M48 family metallopeptidase [bacterium]